MPKTTRPRVPKAPTGREAPPVRKPANTTRVVGRYYADGRIELNDGPEFLTLKQMQEFVGGYIEHVRTTIAHRALICNEEGVLKNLPVNAEATKLVYPGTLMVRGLRGDCLLITN